MTRTGKAITGLAEAVRYVRGDRTNGKACRVETPTPADLRLIETVRRRWDEGKASGRAGPLDIKRILVEERANLSGGRTSRAGPTS